MKIAWISKLISASSTQCTEKEQVASGFTLHIFIRMNRSFALSLWCHRSRVPEHKMQNATKQQLQQACGDNGPTYALMLLALSTLPDLLRLEQLSTTWVATELGWGTSTVCCFVASCKSIQP